MPQTPKSSLKIALDGYHRDSREGTGLFALATMTHEALAAMGAEPTWLFGREGITGRDPVAREVTFHDPSAGAIAAVRALRAARRMAEGLTKRESRAERLALNQVVTGDDPMVGINSAYNAPGLFRLALYQWDLSRAIHHVTLPEPCDVLHLIAPLPVRARGGVRQVTTIADLIPLRLPHSTQDNKDSYLALVRACAAHSDLTVTISEASKADIVQVLGVPDERVAVTHLTTDIQPLTPEEEAHAPLVWERFGLSAQRYLMFVSAIEPKKNLRRLIDAFLEIDTDMPLVIIGRKAWLWEQVIGDLDDRLGEKAKARLRFPGYVSRRDLRFLYAGARASAFPSLYEGFGLPALEAMRMGCPVLTSDIPALREVCADASVTADPYDQDSIRAGLLRLISDDALCRQKAAQGRVQAAKFTPEAYRAQMAAAYARLG